MIRRDEVQSGYLQNLVDVQMGPWKRAAALLQALPGRPLRRNFAAVEAAAVESVSMEAAAARPLL